MGLPELISNVSNPGQPSPQSIATLTQAITTTPAAGTVETYTVSQAAPTNLRSANGQFRVAIDSEIMIVQAKADGSSPWSFTRGAENTTPAAHANTTPIYHLLTQGALDGRYAAAADANQKILLDTYYDSAIYANKTAAINAAIAAVQAIGGTLVCRPGRVYSLDVGAAQYAPNAALHIEGNNATWQSNWGKPRIFDFARTVDYCQFRDLLGEDLTFDANNQGGTTPVVNQSVVGNLIDGDWGQRINADSIEFDRCKWINVPTSTSAASVQCFSLGSVHVAGGEAQTNLTNVRLKQAYMRGGNVGAAVVGNCSGSNTAVQVYHDQIYLDVDHDTGVIPTSASSAASGNVQIGSLGFGDYCEVRLKGANSADVGVEVDGMQTAHVWGVVTDARIFAFFGRNFHAAQDVNSQRMICHGCKHRIVNLSPVTLSAAGFVAGSTITPDPQYGEMVLEDCSTYCASAKMEQVGNAISVPQGALVRGVSIVGKFVASYPNINDQPVSTQIGTPVAILPGGSSFVLGGQGDIEVIYGGAGGANLVFRSLVLSPQTGCKAQVDLGSVVFSSSLTGMTNGQTIGLVLGLGGVGGGSARGRIRRLALGAWTSNDQLPALFYPAPSTVISIDGAFQVEQLDLSQNPVTGPYAVNPNNGVDAANQARLPVRSISMPNYFMPSVPLSGAGGAFADTPFTAASFTSATGLRYVAPVAGEIQFASGTGAGVTAIAVSKDGTTYANVYEQASGALAQDVMAPLETGDYVKVTFATTAPTARVRYRRAQ